MLKHPIKTLAIAAALTAALTATAAAASTGAAQVTADSLSLHSEPSVGSRIIGEAPQGSLLVVGDAAGSGWHKVVYRGAVGYAQAETVTVSETLAGDFGFGTVCEESASLLTSPSLTAPVIGSYRLGESMSITGVYGEWYSVRCGSAAGFIHSDSLALNGGVSDFSEEAKGERIVDAAMQYLDVPYVWGGTSPRGFDCSGLVYYVFKECGYTINRTAASIYDNGTYVEKEELRPGDAICFSSYSNSIGHVGIYIGDGQFIHASSGSGRVIISGLDESYYAARYVGARHIV